MLAILAPLLVFGLVVFVHELGHFVAAKLCGVYAPRFSIGFGPALLRKRVGETEYVLAALPLGGYVRMASREDEAMALLEGGGEHPAGTLPTTGGNAAGRAVDDHVGDPPRARRDWDPTAMAPFGPLPVPEHRWFESKGLAARLFILLAGVTMNVVLAYVVYAGSFVAYGRPYLPAVVDSVIAGRPAALAGFQRGDSVVAIDGAPVRTWMDFVERLQARTAGPTTVEVVRDGTRRALVVTPRPEDATDQITGETRRVGRIGVAPRVTIAREPMPVGDALREGGVATWASATSVVGVVRGLFKGNVEVSNLGGPIAIARTSVEAARDGFETLLSLVAFLSINIAVLNLLPIPVLDGGQVVLNVLEAAKGSAFSVRTREYILRVGIFAIALLFVTVMWNDLARLAGDLLR